MNKTLVFAFVFAFASLADAQEPTDTVAIDPLIVTAARVALPISKVTSAVTVLDGVELQRRGIRTVGEALRTVSGAAVVQSGSYGASTSLFLRGGESDYVQVLIDGVQVNSPAEQFNWSGLAIENIERIEIVKGPASVLYGSDAVTGVVQLFTKQRVGTPTGQVVFTGARGDKIGAQADGGFTNGYASADLAGGTVNRRYSIGVSHFGSGGAYAYNNQHRNTSATAGLSLRMGSSELSTSARYNVGRFHYPTDGTGLLADRNQYQDAASFVFGLNAAHQFSSRVSAHLELHHNANDATTDDRPDDAADTVGFFSFHSDDRFSRQNANVRLNYNAGTSTFTLGGEIERQSNSTSSSSPFGETPESTEERNNNALYGQWLAEWQTLTLQLGARVEDNERFGGFTTYRAGVSARITPALRVRGSAGTAFKEPRFFEQFAQGFVRGNPDLEPELSRNIEAGVDYTWQRLSLSATWFNQEFEDLIQYVAVTASPTDPNYQNVAGARASGLEMGGTIAWPRFGLTATYTVLDTKVTDAGDGEDPSFQEGEQLLRRPRHSGSLAGTFYFASGSVGATAHYFGARDDLSFATFPAERIILYSYTRLDVNGEVRVSSALAGTFKIENALDEEYEEILGFPAPRRVIHVGARLAIR